MTVLVTGGAGYIGSHMVAKLCQEHRKVVVLDNLSTGDKRFIPSGVDFIQGDIRSRDIVYQAIKNNDVDTVMHFAASIKVEESVEKPLEYFRNNTEATMQLALLAAELGVKHFIFSSTAAVYGNPAVLPVREDTPLAPQSPYGTSKQLAEHILREVCASSKSMRYVSLRYFNVLGVHPILRRGYKLESQPSHLVRRALAVALGRDKFLPVYGTDYPTPDGTCIRDYISVQDVAEAHLSALLHLEFGGESGTYNLGYGHGYSVLEIVAAVEKVTGKKLSIETLGRRPGDVISMIADSSRLKKDLRWMPSFDNLEQMIHNQFQWESAPQRAETEPVA